MLYDLLIKPIVFRFSPERAHHLTMSAWYMALRVPILGGVLSRFFTIKHPSLHRKVFGLTFENPVGLAAGFDKDGKYYPDLGGLGFGFVEVGTVTPIPQDGNPQPRLFRLLPDEAIINRMGFNNQGAEALAERLRTQPRPKGMIIGGNIGKNKVTANEDATSDYVKCFEILFDVVDYFAVNISSPNTPGLRDLQEKEPLLELLHQLQMQNRKHTKPKPILLKIAPDLTDSQLDDIIDIVQQTKLDGIIATNTTIYRSTLQTPADQINQIGAGGVSGAPLTTRATEVIRYLHTKSGGKIPIIGVGGIMTVQDALDKIAAGAVLIQVYTGLIYTGPGLVKAINKALIQK